MKELRLKMLSFVLMAMLLFAAGLFGGCANNHPIDESKLPDLEKQQEEQQTQQQEEQAKQQEQQAQNDSNSGGDSGGTSNDNSAGDGTEQMISESEAMGIVLAKVPGASKEDIVSFGKDYDDGLWIYEGEVRYEGLEYDFEIDAQTGNLLEWEIDD